MFLFSNDNFSHDPPDDDRHRLRDVRVLHRVQRRRRVRHPHRPVPGVRGDRPRAASEVGEKDTTKLSV